MPTNPDQPTAADVLDAETARESLREMAAVVRTIFGVNLNVAPATYVPDVEPEQALPTPTDPVEGSDQAHAPAEPQGQRPAQPAALTSVPMPTTIPVEGVPASAPEPAPAALSVPSTIQVPVELPAPAEHQSALELPVQGALQVPTEIPTPTDPPAAQAVPYQVPGAPAAIPVPGLALPELPQPSETEQPQEAPAPAETAEPGHPAEPEYESAEPESATHDETPRPSEDTPRPDRRSMALLQEIAFLDD